MISARTALHPPGPKSLIPLATLQAFQQDRIAYLLKMASYGDISFVNGGALHFYLINHPDSIQDVLVTHNRNFIKSRGLQAARPVLGQGLLTSEGELHLRQRRLVQPAFHRQRIEGYAKTMVEIASRVGQRWQYTPEVNMTQEMMRLTLAVAGKTLFDVDLENEAQEISVALTDAMALFNRGFSPFEALLERLPLASNARFEKGLERLNKTIYGMIADHRASGDRGDLLSMLLTAEDLEGNGEQMTDQQIRDEAMTIFLAGHETTAIALTWTWYLLSCNPQVEAELQRELKRVLGDRLPGYQDIPDLVYSRMVFAEAMRQYPPAYVLGRIAVDDYEVGGYVIPAGATVLMSQYVMHHDPRYYPDPYHFDPLRWTPEAESLRPKYSYFPFGGGPRVCIGEPFAWMEGVLVLATLAQRWQPRFIPNYPVKFKPLITLRPKYPMMMRLEPQSD